MKTKPFQLIELFTFPSINGLTEEFIRKHPGVIPVYGGKMTETPVGYIDDNLKEAIFLLLIFTSYQVFSEQAL